jgi:probable F420-dependent oxidoreductase
MTRFKVGAFFPHTDIGVDAIEIRDFAQAVEAMGYTYLANADHVVGANRASRPDWQGAYDSTTRMYEPLVLFSYLAGVTKTLEFLTAMIIAPQRQTALIAKQAANLDVFCGGRLRIGVGTGWNPVEYEALGMPWEDRGARLDEQIRVLRRLWSEENVTENGKYHKISDAGLAPMPLQRPIPIWIGGAAAPAIRRAARLGDGWMPFLSAEGAEDKLGAYQEAVRAAGRDPAEAPLENVVHLGTAGGGPNREVDDVIADIEIWKKVGAAGACVYTMARGLGSVANHIAVFQKVSDALQLARKPKTV